jgi:hypothetical protein
VVEAVLQANVVVSGLQVQFVTSVALQLISAAVGTTTGDDYIITDNVIFLVSE